MMHERLEAARRAVVVGGGYIGVELADALTRRGLDVALIEMAESVLTTVDAQLGAVVSDELERHGVDVRAGTSSRRSSATAVTGPLLLARPGCRRTSLSWRVVSTH